MSDTGKTKARRQRKNAAQGRARKKKLEKEGTTPKSRSTRKKPPKPRLEPPALHTARTEWGAEPRGLARSAGFAGGSVKRVRFAVVLHDRNPGVGGRG